MANICNVFPGVVMLRSILVFCALALAGCYGQQNDPLEQYLLGVRDGLAEARFPCAEAEDATCEPYSGSPPEVLVSWREDDGPLGTCRRVDGIPLVTIYPLRIIRQAQDVAQGRLLIGQVVAHELQHARLTCTDADHAGSL
jgi:hypothetical protein